MVCQWPELAHLRQYYPEGLILSVNASESKEEDKPSLAHILICLEF